MAKNSNNNGRNTTPFDANTQNTVSITKSAYNRKAKVLEKVFGVQIKKKK